MRKLEIERNRCLQFRVFVLAGDNLAAMNSFEQCRLVVPVETAVNNASNRFQVRFPRFSVTVFRVPVK